MTLEPNLLHHGGSTNPGMGHHLQHAYNMVLRAGLEPATF